MSKRAENNPILHKLAQHAARCGKNPDDCLAIVGDVWEAFEEGRRDAIREMVEYAKDSDAYMKRSILTAEQELTNASGQNDANQG